MNQKIAIHQKTFNICWGDMDALGHVNNARYFDYFQEARLEWLASLGFDLKEASGPILLQISCTYLKPIIYPATLLLQSSMHSPGRSSFIVEHAIYQNDVLTTEASSKIVWIDYRLQKSVPIPAAIRSLFDKA